MSAVTGANEALHRADQRLVDCLARPGIGVEPRPSLEQLIDAVDSVIGAPLRRMAADRTARRLTVIPHGLLHLVPFWALPSLE